MSDERKLAGLETITQAATEVVRLAQDGVSPDRFLVEILGFEPDGVRQAAEGAAEEEFQTIPGLPPGVAADGRLRKLGFSANQRELVKAALVETYVSALMVGAIVEIARLRSELAELASDEQEGEGQHE